MITAFYLAIVVVVCTIQHTQTALIIALTGGKSPARVLSAVLLCGCFVYQTGTVLALTHCLLNKVIAGNVMFGSCVQNIHFVLAVDCDENCPSTSSSQPKSEAKSQRGAVTLPDTDLFARMQTSLRLIHCQQKAGRSPKSPNKSSTSSIHKIRITRERFLVHQTASILSECIIQEVTWRAFRRCFDAHWQEHFASSAESPFLGASRDHLGVRVTATLLFWAGTYCLLDAGYCFTSMISVAFKLTEPDEWPPLFGSIGDAYSVKRFWGKFWHQLLRHPLIFFSNAATSAITRVLPSSISRYQRAISFFGIFMISALMHSLTDIQYKRYGLTDTFPMLRFFAASFAALVLEMAWIRVYRAWRIKIGKEFNRLYNEVNILPERVISGLSVERIVGYVWVAVWVCSLTPSLVYPPLRALEHKASLLLQ